MPNRTTLSFPPQKLSIGKKTEDWGKRCIEAAEDLAIYRHDGVRESYKNKKTNYNLANDVLDTSDLEKVCNPMGIKNATFPAKMQNYPIANPKIDLLVGEERKRRFSWSARVVNDDAITDKENGKKEEIFKFLQQKIQEIHEKESAPKMQQAQAEQQQMMQQAQGANPEQAQQMQQQAQQKLQQIQQEQQQELQKELQKLNKYLSFEYQDIRERMATHILTYLYKSMDIKEMFARGFEDALIAGEEIYCADIVAGEPTLRRVNPLNIHTVRSGESPFIDDSDIIVEDYYMPPGTVIDDYHDVLKDEHIKRIDEGLTGEGDAGFISIGEKEPSWSIDGLINTESDDAHHGTYGTYWDNAGNIRVTRVLWRSYKKIGKLSYYDQETNEKLETIVPEDYRVNKDTGEEVTWMWINEWWEGTRIGEDIFVKVQPRPVQLRSMTNLSKCGSGYVGMAYNINSSKAKSLMDRMKPYQYLYNVFMYRTELAFAKAKGKIPTLDLAQVPDHWDVDKWMYYAEVQGWAVKDSFKEAKKGAAQGKLAGQMNSQSNVLDADLGNYIQQHIMMLQFIETQLGKIAGVTEQRQGQIENRELVGNVDRSVTQSSHITEKWFALHNNVKKQALAVLLETAKHAFKNKTDKRIQYVLDDMSTSILSFDGQQFNEADYGIIISDASSDQELITTLKGLAQAGLQSDKLNFSQIMDLYTNPSIASMRRNIESAEQEKMQRDQQAQEQQAKQAKEMQQMQQQAQQAQQQHEMAKIDKEYSYKLEMEKMKMAADFEKHSKDLDNDGIPDVVEVEKIRSTERIKAAELEVKKNLEEQKLDLEEDKLDIERAKLGIEDRKRETESKNKDKELKMKERESKSKEKIERMKARQKPVKK